MKELTETESVISRDMKIRVARFLFSEINHSDDYRRGEKGKMKEKEKAKRGRIEKKGVMMRPTQTGFIGID